MALVQEIKDGQVVSNTTTDTTTTSASNTYDKDMFLQLLVAEMKYQDPLEPTSNSEYVAELASFSQIEATEAVEDKMDDISANSLVGKYVIIETTVNGESTTISGAVDYIMKDDDGNYQVAVNDGLYDLDDVTTVADEDYYNATMLSASFNSYVSALPSLNEVTTQDEEKVATVRSLYDSLTDYQKQFISSDDYETLTSLEKRIASLKESDS